MRKVDFVLFDDPRGVEAVCQAFERGGFFDIWPEQCMLRNGVFMLEDQVRKTYVVVVCVNNNSNVIWQ